MTLSKLCVKKCTLAKVWEMGGGKKTGDKEGNWGLLKYSVCDNHRACFNIG